MLWGPPGGPGDQAKISFLLEILFHIKIALGLFSQKHILVAFRYNFNYQNLISVIFLGLCETAFCE